ncbi:hypothetical protein K470DRAFT_255824 [Piedraia hortae CBS 480.64]|uniref:Phosphatidate phosphatase APP1 catalytic domain-containing protein n=1 Tax=Piedraia hortae CBS 480.64 TaxID=1314780 RepID=A0A6A7C520_9PEZI|nr:hypothetical protein K470DRAFT_255824 [Piedraia hortae CBS 480.64]
MYNYPSDQDSGRRRRKIANFLKAANEMRQSYFSVEGGEANGFGSFGEGAVVRSGNEEMMLFPSYARTSKRDSAVVKADVRGWIYTPHSGPHTRRQRLLIGIARQLTGLPAPPTPPAATGKVGGEPPSRSTSPSRQEEDLISFEAEQLVKRGEAEARNAQRGRYTEAPKKNTEDDGVYEAKIRDPSPIRSSARSVASSIHSGYSPPISPKLESFQSRSTWPLPSKLGPSELVTANEHLLNRLKPFMHTGLANASVNAMFYNDEDSQQFTAYTDAQGHFSFHVPLEFVPTHVKVLASDKLSCSEEVRIINRRGVSLISDIDDTIKHSGINQGPREIFRNAFIRDHGEMTIDGVREWYTTLHDMGVKMHYVSNSPWQMYPALATYFQLANLPEGSFHLKLYSGALAGIFEPVAERKKTSLNKIMRDFPERKFILVGDSGEADLEVYTDVALDNPGKVLGIFIRDVTRPVKTGYFDMSASPSPSRNNSRTRQKEELKEEEVDLIDFAEEKKNPPIPPNKPRALRSPSPELKRKPLPPPPRPRKPSTSVKVTAPSPLCQVTQTSPTEGRVTKPALPPRPGTAMSSLLPSATAVGGVFGGGGAIRDAASATASWATSKVSKAPPPPPPPRNKISTIRRGSSSSTLDELGSVPPSPTAEVSKKEYLWTQRLARARALLEHKGVVLKTWRVGSDVAHICVTLVEAELRAEEGVR